MEIDKKLKVVAKISKRLNSAGVVWAVGASLLLYFKARTDTFNDIDIVCAEQDFASVKRVLGGFGSHKPSRPNERYRTANFAEFSVEGVDVDVMAGLVIVKDGHEYSFSLSQNDIAEYIELEGERIPLQSLAAWRRYYELMGRDEKAEMIGEI